jgi:hypothetical protein
VPQIRRKSKANSRLRSPAPQELSSEDSKAECPSKSTERFEKRSIRMQRDVWDTHGSLGLCSGSNPYSDRGSVQRSQHPGNKVAAPEEPVSPEQRPQPVMGTAR